MAFNGSGTFVINTAGQPVVPNTVISATAFNALTNDLANGLSTCITKDGQTTPTANIPMGNNKITGLAPGTSGTDAANLSQVQGSTAKLLQSVTGTDTITAAMVPALTSYSAGQMFYFVAAGDNTGAVTINIDSLGAKSVTRDGSTALVAGDIVSGEVALIVYDGTRFQLLNGNSFTNLNVSNNLTLSGGAANGVLYLNGSKVATSGSVLTFDGTSVTFGSTAQRIIADMSNATVSNRFAFQTSTTNGNTQVNAIPNGSATTSQFIAYNSSDPNNASSIQMAALSTAIRLLAGQTGTGTYLPITFFTNGSEQMRLDTSGNLGIGTTSPVFKLVVSNAGAQGFEFDPSNGIFQVYNRSTSAYGELRPYASLMRFFTGSSPVETMRLDSSGNLGLGVTPSAWGRGKAFEFGSIGNSLWGDTGPNGIVNVTANAYLSTSNLSTGWKYAYTGPAGRYQISETTHSWHTAASGTAGNTISFTQAMTLDASGNLGIGTTTINYRVVADCNSAGNNDNGFAVRNTNSSAYGGSYNFEHAVTGGNSPVRASFISSEGGGGNSFMRFATTVSGTLAVRMRITNTGSIVAGNEAALATTATDGFLYVPTCAGTPTGTPTAITGMAPIVVDTTNNKLYFYSGGTWRDAGP